MTVFEKAIAKIIKNSRIICSPRRIKRNISQTASKNPLIYSASVGTTGKYYYEISKAIDKARELSAKSFEKQQRKLQPKTQTTEQETSQILPKPVRSVEAAAYPKLLKIYKELNRQNRIIFDAWRECNALEAELENKDRWAG